MDVTIMQGGKAVKLDKNQLAAHIEQKVRRVISRPNSLACADAIIVHKGGNTAGGALNGIQYKGAAIYHESRNFGGAAQGCAVFFADSGGGTAKILAIGVHSGQGRHGPVYDIDWVSQDWGGSARWQAGTQVQL